MNQQHLEWRCIVGGRQSGLPHGYILPNGVVVIWNQGRNSNNFANIAFATAAYPNLIIVS